MSHEREGKARRSFRLKVEELEGLVKSGRPGSQWFPRNVRELVAWEDVERGLSAWVSFSVAALNGPNADLRLRFDAALRELKRTSDKRPRRGRDITHAMALAEVKALAQQNLELVADKQILAKRVALLEGHMEKLYERERELVETLNKLLPPHRALRAAAPG